MNSGKLPPGRSMGAEKEPGKAMVLDVVWGYGAWHSCSTGTGDNVPRFPGLAELFIPYLFSSELWLARPLFLPAQPIPQVFHPRPPPAIHPTPASSRKINPTPDSYHFSHHVCPGPMLLLPGIFHQFYFQWHPWLAQSCSSHDWTFALLHVPVWDCCRDSPLHSAWMKI